MRMGKFDNLGKILLSGDVSPHFVSKLILFAILSNLYGAIIFVS